MIWSVFSYKANINQYYLGEYRDSSVVDAIFSPNDKTDHIATFTFPDSKANLVKPVTKELFTAFHGNGQEPLKVSLLVSDQDLGIPPSHMILISKVVGGLSSFVAIFSLFAMCLKKKETAAEKRQKLKARV